MGSQPTTASRSARTGTSGAWRAAARSTTSAATGSCPTRGPAGLMAAILGAVPGAGTLVRTIAEIDAFEVAGEVSGLRPAN
jgi:hypothetical protein